MSDDQHFAGLHTALTSLSVDVGRLSERLIALDAKLVNHTQSEHQEFKEALAIVGDIRRDVVAIQTVIHQGRGAWIAMAKLAAILMAVIGVASTLWHIISGGKV